MFCGGEEKLGPGSLEQHFERRVASEPEEASQRLAPRADALINLPDEPVLPASAKLWLAALALSLGLRYEAPGRRLEPARYEPVPGTARSSAVIGAGQRTGETAMAGTGRRCCASGATSR